MKCLVCGAPACFVGVFEPIDPQAWGAEPGKSAAIAYWSCASRHHPDEFERLLAATAVEVVCSADPDKARKHAYYRAIDRAEKDNS
jgi:hypothetical protein